MQANRFGDLAALFFFGHVLVLDPLEAVRGDFPARILHCGHLFGAAGEGGGDAVDRHGDVPFGEQLVQTPKTCARTVFVDRLHVPVALPRPLCGARDVGEECFGLSVTVQNAVLAAFFVVQNKADGDFGPTGPFGIWRVRPVADHIARISVHACLLSVWSNLWCCERQSLASDVRLITTRIDIVPMNAAR